MTVRNLDSLFAPKSIAVIGASLRKGSIGSMVWLSALNASFKGQVWPVSLNYRAWENVQCFPDIDQLPAAPQVAVICTRPETWPSLVGRLGLRGTKAVVIIGTSAERRPDQKRAVCDAPENPDDWTIRTLAAARPHLVRVIGPASLGVATPALGVCLGAPASDSSPGGVAWVSNSNALTNGVLGWARARGLGFSRIVALGDQADVDSGDILDFLASDASTRAILLSVDNVKSARKFMSAARAAARNKPVLVLRTCCDDPFDRLYSAAFRRAGLVRVDTLDDLLDEIETLGIGRVAAGNAATIITSDRGVGMLAKDAFTAAGDDLAQWSGAARDGIVSSLPHADVGNPLLLGDDASPEDFGRAIEALGPFPESGTAFVVHAPTHTAPVTEVARVLISKQKHAYRGLLACFFGCVDSDIRDELHANGIPVHTTPHRLGKAFARLVGYRHGRELLMQTPDGAPIQLPDGLDTLQLEIRTALRCGFETLNDSQTTRLLRQFDIPVDPTPIKAALSNESMEVRVRLLDHPVFGPAFEFKTEGVFELGDAFHEFALPPLNPVLARDLVMRSPRARDLPVESLLTKLTALSHLVCYIEEIVSLCVTLRITRDRVTLYTPRIKIGAHRKPLAVVPYPRHLEETLDWHGMRITVRPIRPEDEDAHRAFVAMNTAEDLRLRFFGSVRSFEHSQLARMTQIDYDREIALIVTRVSENGKAETLGVARAIADPDNETAEFAVAARSDMKGLGFGKLLLSRIIDYERQRGTRWLVGEALRENAGMIALARKAGFEVHKTDDPGVVGFRMRLCDSSAALPSP